MVVPCPSCGTRFKIAETDLPATGARAKCQRCNKPFIVRPGSSDAVPRAEKTAPPERPRPATQRPMRVETPESPAAPRAMPTWPSPEPEAEVAFGDVEPSTVKGRLAVVQGGLRAFVSPVSKQVGRIGALWPLWKARRARACEQAPSTDAKPAPRPATSASPLRRGSTWIAFAVCCAAVATSFLVTWTAARAIRDFIALGVNERLPVALQSARREADLWYRQLRLDLEVLSRSSAVVYAFGDGTLNAEQTEHYLAYVLEQYPQFAALFLVDNEGTVLTWVGETHVDGSALAGHVARQRFPQLETFNSGSGILEIGSAVVRSGDRGVGALSAVIHQGEIEKLFRDDRLAWAGEVFLVGDQGRVLTRTSSREPGSAYPGGLPRAGAAVRTFEYTNAAGEQVVSAGLRLELAKHSIFVEQQLPEALEPVSLLIKKVVALHLPLLAGLVLIAAGGAVRARRK